MEHQADVRGAERLDRIFQAMRWNLLEAPADEPFITSDNPVIVADPARAAAKSPKDYPAPSFAVQVLFPISPKYLLVGDFRGPRPAKIMPIPDDDVRRHNENQIGRAHREVYASYGSDPLPQHHARALR